MKTMTLKSIFFALSLLASMISFAQNKIEVESLGDGAFVQGTKVISLIEHWVSEDFSLRDPSIGEVKRLFADGTIEYSIYKDDLSGPPGATNLSIHTAHYTDLSAEVQEHEIYNKESLYAVGSSVVRISKFFSNGDLQYDADLAGDEPFEYSHPRGVPTIFPYSIYRGQLHEEIDSIGEYDRGDYVITPNGIVGEIQAIFENGTILFETAQGARLSGKILGHPEASREDDMHHWLAREAKSTFKQTDENTRTRSYGTSTGPLVVVLVDDYADLLGEIRFSGLQRVFAGDLKVKALSKILNSRLNARSAIDQLRETLENKE